MSDFEKIYQIEPPREMDQQIEKYPSIEFSDCDYLRNLGFILEEDKLKDLIESDPPLISMKLEMPKLEKAIRKGKKNAKSTSETSKRKSKKANTKPNESAMADIQKEL